MPLSQSVPRKASGCAGSRLLREGGAAPAAAAASSPPVAAAALATSAVDASLVQKSDFDAIKSKLLQTHIENEKLKQKLSGIV
jgi:hypothetical protein